MALTTDGKSIFDTLNSSIAEIHEEADEDVVYRWDEVGRRNIAFAAHARTDIPLSVKPTTHASGVRRVRGAH